MYLRPLNSAFKTVKTVRTDFVFTSILPHAREPAPGRKPRAAVVRSGAPALSRSACHCVPALPGQLTGQLLQGGRLPWPLDRGPSLPALCGGATLPPPIRGLHPAPSPAAGIILGLSVFGDKCSSLQPPCTFIFSCSVCN